jgi:hypothetical protein
MPRFEVVTPEPGGVSGRLAVAASELTAARSALERVSVAGPAADHPGVTAALGEFVAAWSPSINAMHDGATALGERVESARSAYEATESSAISR